MKIAVQLFGHLRTYEECYPLLKQHLLDKYDCDVFMHTWDTIDHSTKTWHNRFMENAGSDTRSIEDKLKKIYSLKNLKIEHQNIEDLGVINAIDKDISIYGMRCMFHSMQAVNSLREEYQQQTGAKYDFVITLRPDLQLLEKFDLDYYLERMTEEEINNSFFTYFFPMLGLWNDFRKIGASDIFYFARPEVISNIFKNINYVVDKIQPVKINFGPEVYFIELVEHLGYKVNLIKYAENTEFLIKRPTQSGKKKKNFAMKVSLKKSYLCLFQGMNFNILDFNLNLFNKMHIRICIGGSDDK